MQNRSGLAIAVNKPNSVGGRLCVLGASGFASDRLKPE